MELICVAAIFFVQIDTWKKNFAKILNKDQATALRFSSPILKVNQMVTVREHGYVG